MSAFGNNGGESRGRASRNVRTSQGRKARTNTNATLRSQAQAASGDGYMNALLAYAVTAGIREIEEEIIIEFIHVTVTEEFGCYRNQEHGASQASSLPNIPTHGWKEYFEQFPAMPPPRRCVSLDMSHYQNMLPQYQTHTESYGMTGCYPAPNHSYSSVHQCSAAPDPSILPSNGGYQDDAGVPVLHVSHEDLTIMPNHQEGTCMSGYPTHCLEPDVNIISDTDILSNYNYNMHIYSGMHGSDECKDNYANISNQEYAQANAWARGQSETEPIESHADVMKKFKIPEIEEDDL